MASNTIIPLPAGRPFRAFSLYLNYGRVALLPDEHDLVVNTETGHYVLINWNVRYIVTDGCFHPVGELPLALILLDAWPSYTENFKLMQAITDRLPEEIIEVLDREGNQALQPLHQLVDACRNYFRPIGIEIEDVNGLGYKLSRFVAGRE